MCGLDRGQYYWEIAFSHSTSKPADIVCAFVGVVENRDSNIDWVYSGWDDDYGYLLNILRVRRFCGGFRLLSWHAMFTTVDGNV